MGIKLATTAEEFDGIRRIWEERFTSCQIYLNTIFKHIFPLCRSYIYKENNTIVSVASFMPMEFISPEIPTRLQGFYMFGVATETNSEGRNLAASIIEYASKEIYTEGYSFIFERPANQSLNNYYLKLGFLKSLPKRPYLFKLATKYGSTENNHKETCIKSLSEAILEEIRIEFPARFEWKNKEILGGLILLGELEEHQKGYTPKPSKEETYIAVKNLSPFTPEIYNNSFFCFPME